MGFFIEVLATSIAGMISQWHQEGRISLTRYFIIFWVLFFVSFLIIFLLDAPFKKSDFILAIITATSISAACWMVMYIRFLLSKKSKNRHA